MHLDDTAWTLEVAIPWADLGLISPQSGDLLGFNVCRNRYLSGRTEWSNWAQTKGNFHDVERFAHLVLSPTPEEIGRLGGELRKGERSGPILLFGPEGYSGTSYRALA